MKTSQRPTPITTHHARHSAHQLLTAHRPSPTTHHITAHTQRTAHCRPSHRPTVPLFRRPLPAHPRARLSCPLEWNHAGICSVESFPGRTRRVRNKVEPPVEMYPRGPCGSAVAQLSWEAQRKAGAEEEGASTAAPETEAAPPATAAAAEAEPGGAGASGLLWERHSSPPGPVTRAGAASGTRRVGSATAHPPPCPPAADSRLPRLLAA